MCDNDCCCCVLLQHLPWGGTLSSLSWVCGTVVLMLREHLTWHRHCVTSPHWGYWTWVGTLLTHRVLDTLVSWVVGSGAMGSLVTSDCVSVLHPTGRGLLSKCVQNVLLSVKPIVLAKLTCRLRNATTTDNALNMSPWIQIFKCLYLHSRWWPR